MNPSIPFVRIIFCFIVWTTLITRAESAGAQDSLDYSVINPLTLALPQSNTLEAAVSSTWRLSGFAGYHQQYQPGYLNDLYLTHGFHAGLSTDYFIGQHWGLGILLGYQNLVVSDLYKQDPSIPKSPSPRIFPLTSLHSFILAAGPAFSFALSRRLTLDINLRGGLFYTDIPVLGAYYLTTAQDNLLMGTLAGSTIIPTDQRVHAGFNGFLGVGYQVTQQLRLGISTRYAYSSATYARINTSNLFSQKRMDLSLYGVQMTASYQFGTTTQRKSPPVLPLPICYPPVLEPAQINSFDGGPATNRPVVKWHSSAPVYTEDERFTFRLYTLPGNKLLFEKVVQEPQFIWPDRLALPDSTSSFFYMVHANRVDDNNHSCRSEPVVGILNFFKKPSTTQPVTHKEPTHSYTFSLYALPASLVPEDSVQPATRARGFLAALRRVFTNGTPYTRKSATPPDSGKLLRDLAPTLVYEVSIPAVNLDFIWPARVPLPKKPAVYQLVISQPSNQEIRQTEYRMVEPDGCSQIIDEDTKNRYVPSNSTLNNPLKPDSPQRKELYPR